MDEVRGQLRTLLGADSPAADLLAAQIALETADGKHSYSYNVGNMKAPDKEGVKYQSLKTWEMVDGKRVDMREPFLAHDTLEEGLAEYVAYLDRKGLLDAADSGDVRTFNEALKKAGYYTADKDQYERNMRKRLDAWGKKQ